MIKMPLSVCCWLLCNTVAAAAGLNDFILNQSLHIQQNRFAIQAEQQGVLSITMQAAPVAGLPIPKVLVLRDFHTMMRVNLNWGDTINLTVPSGGYRIINLPVSDGTDIYVADSLFASVLTNTNTSKLIGYHIT